LCAQDAQKSGPPLLSRSAQKSFSFNTSRAQLSIGEARRTGDAMDERVFMSGFFEELKRRKVYRVAIAYIVASWALAQGIAQVLPVFDIPNSRIRVVILLLLIGFPIALVLAWIFDITPTGIERTSRAQPATVPGRRRRRNVIWLGIAGIVISSAVGFLVLPRAVARSKVEKSIAVLPFDNLSDDKENAYFADGIQDDILTNLSKISDLKVISRTSVMQYKGKAPNVREIGKALGVSTILEGSVRRSGNRVRLNVQLIDATNDEHLWASDYDRELTDVFAIQTDLAQNISDALQAKLSPAEKSRIESKPTENSDAYLAFVQAHNLVSTSLESFETLKQAEHLYARAIELDPKFALAFARYSYLESWIVHTFERTAERRQKARALAEQALQLQPDLPEGHLALGFSLYYGDNDFEGALREFEIAQRGLPNEAEAYLALGAIQRRMGNWSESNANLEKAASLNPKDGWVFQNLAMSYQVQRKFDAANKAIDRGMKAAPQNIGLWETKAKLAVVEKGDVSVSEQAFESAKSMPLTAEGKIKVAGARADVFLLERKYQEGLNAAESLSDDLLSTVPVAICGKYYLIGFARRGLHDEAGARVAFLKAKEFGEEELKKSPDSPDLRVLQAKILAYLGEKDSALAEAKRATDLLPESKDAFGGPDITAGVAEVECILGENDRAIELLDGLLSRPSNITVPLLKLSPAWDPLRQDPKFQAMLEKHGVKT